MCLEKSLLPEASWEANLLTEVTICNAEIIFGEVIRFAPRWFGFPELVWICNPNHLFMPQKQQLQF